MWEKLTQHQSRNPQNRNQSLTQQLPGICRRTLDDGWCGIYSPMERRPTRERKQTKYQNFRTTFIAEDCVHWDSYLTLAVDGCLPDLLEEQWQPLESQESMKKERIQRLSIPSEKSSCWLWLGRPVQSLTPSIERQWFCWFTTLMTFQDRSRNERRRVHLADEICGIS